MATRANIEALVIRRVGALLEAVSLDGTTVDGSNPDVNDPLGWALRQLGYAVASPVEVADADLATVSDADLDELLDLVELRCLETAENAAAGLVDISAGPHRENLGQMAQRLAERVARKRALIESLYGGLGQSVEAGYLTMTFAEHETS